MPNRMPQLQKNKPRFDTNLGDALFEIMFEIMNIKVLIIFTQHG